MSKLLWTILLFLSGALALVQVTTATIKFLRYDRLEKNVPAKVTTWEIAPRGSKFTLTAIYSFSFKEKTFEGKTTFAKPYFLNKESAEAAKKQGEKRPWEAWVDPDKPNVSSLQRRFPLKNIFYAVCSLGVFLYFLWLKFQSDMLFKIK